MLIVIKINAFLLCFLFRSRQLLLYGLPNVVFTRTFIDFFTFQLLSEPTHVHLTFVYMCEIQRLEPENRKILEICKYHGKNL
jgi:hypothetical protein